MRGARGTPPSHPATPSPEGERRSHLGAPEKTAAAWRGDAFTVGDHGHLDDGWLTLLGREHLSAVQRPEVVPVVDALPRNANGKVLRPRP